MIRATTPKHIFLFGDDHDPAEYKRILITYAQGDDIVLEKTKDDLTIETIVNEDTGDLLGYKAWFRMTQDETKKFRANAGKLVQVQVRALTVEGEALASDKRIVSVQDVLNDEVLT